MILASFKQEQTKEVLELIGVDTSKHIVGRCYSCNYFLTLKNIGNISQGKLNGITFNKLYCQNPACFAKEVAKEYVISGKGEKK